MHNTRNVTKIVAAMMIIGSIAAGYAGAASHTLHLPLALAILALAAATSKMKVKLPGIDGNMSVNLPFLLTAAISLSAAEAVVVACVSTAVQCWPRKDAKFSPQQMGFNLSMMAFAISATSWMFHADWFGKWTSSPVGVALAAATLFLGQTLPVSGIVAASKGESAASTWLQVAQLSFPYYVVSAGLSFMVLTVSSQLGWGLALAVFPVMYGIHRSYRMYFTRIAESVQPEVVLVRAAGA
jgi:hypothetical protein